jgi:hypothetical protein
VRTGTWVGVELDGRPEAAEIEHRVHDAIVQLPLAPDHIATHVVPDAVPHAAASLRFPVVADDEPALLAAIVRPLVDVLGGTAAALPDDAVAPVVAGDPDRASRCLDLASAARERRSGRCTRFPGQDRLTRVHPVHRILERSAITRIAGSGWPVGSDDLVDTRGFLRPVFDQGELVLWVGPAAGGVLIPQEIADPHQCCGGHRASATV